VTKKLLLRLRGENDCRNEKPAGVAVPAGFD